MSRARWSTSGTATPVSTPSPRPGGSPETPDPALAGGPHGARRRARLEALAPLRLDPAAGAPGAGAGAAGHPRSLSPPERRGGGRASRQHEGRGHEARADGELRQRRRARAVALGAEAAPD